MKKEWVKYLCDPVDKSDLVLSSVSKVVDGYIVTGSLKSRSGKVYKIKNGVPVFLNKKTQEVSSVDSFAYEWNEFDFDYGKKGWVHDVVNPTLGSTKYFKGKVIADCGAGSGRQSLWMAKAGAKFVFSFELSNTAHTILKKVTHECRDKIFVIQADISHPPVKANIAKIDLVYCVNVIQHVRNPKAATVQLSKLMKNDSTFLFNIYLTRGKTFIFKLLEWIRLITAHLPYLVVKYLSFFLSIVLCFFFNHSFKETWLDIYDLIGGHKYQKFYTEKELGDILQAAKLKVIKRSRYALLLRKK